MTDAPESQKRALRAELRERRRVRTATEREREAASITQHLIDLTSDLRARSIAAYLSLPEEPGTRDFVKWAAENDIRVLLPVSRVDGLLDWAPYDGNDEDEDLLGMPTPTSELLGPIAINDVDLIVVPAASVDRTGMRLGWGRGYFDKTLGSMENCPPVYAVIFDDELVESVPSERHDQRVDGVVTPSGIVAL
ncbi:5-formyltetrahydrofolate cyclo-ligase [Leifsonia sp. AK011]|uniref:5-formyltetrahydrofolate cyclo-ligase n=1 Tax=Leifsonia sp. AK011 TaxID=2723075 RepID=UPI0015CC0062|nr:5-formyltetrahydrofolate cyclo-ligase [Leifsonia sp. AK011]NYF09962.1 5-formyltetrahydrofolate cyclo-ligase [Leifsonia sp. AK011]